MKIFILFVINWIRIGWNYRLKFAGHAYFEVIINNSKSKSPNIKTCEAKNFSNKSKSIFKKENQISKCFRLQEASKQGLCIFFSSIYNRNHEPYMACKSPLQPICGSLAESASFKTSSEPIGKLST